LKIKDAIVQKDPLEEGLRKQLNFGHTMGHAVESNSLKNDAIPLLHGEAIAIGMVCEAYISQAACGLKAAQLEEVTTTIFGLFNCHAIDSSQYHQIMEYMKQDKKNSLGKLNFTLLSSIGSAKENQLVDSGLILESLDYYNSYC